MEESQTKPTHSITAMPSQIKQKREDANKTLGAGTLGGSLQSVCRMLTSGLALLMFTVHQKTKSLSPQVSEKPVLNK